MWEPTGWPPLTDVRLHSHDAFLTFHNITGGFASALMQKDLSIAGDAARAVGAPLPMAALAQQIYALLASHGQGGRDFSVVYDFVKGGSTKEKV